MRILNRFFQFVRTLGDILFVTSLIFFYWIDFEKILPYIINNLLLILLSIFLIFFIWFYPLCAFFNFNNQRSTRLIVCQFFIQLILSIISISLPFIPTFISWNSSYYRFLLTFLHIILVLVAAFLLPSESYVIILIQYAINRRIILFFAILIFFLILNISISVVISFSVSLEQSKYLLGVEIKDQWWQFFLLSLVNCLCSIIDETGDMNLIIIIALTTIINSILFFSFSLVFAQSIIYVIINRPNITFFTVRT